MSILLLFLKLQRLELGFFELGLAQSREDPPGLIKCLGLLKIGPFEVLFKLFEFSRQKIFQNISCFIVGLIQCKKCIDPDLMLADSCPALDLCWRNHARFDKFV